MCVFSQIKDRKHIELNFHSVAGIISQGWDLRVLVGQKLRVGICDGASTTAHSSFSLQLILPSSDKFGLCHLMQAAISGGLYASTVRTSWLTTART